MKQTDRVLKYLNECGSITQAEALYELGIMRLASRVSDLRNMGIDIEKQMISGKNRFDEPIHYARYSIRRDNHVL